MKSYPNQRIVKTEKKEPTDKNNLYAVMNIKALQTAMVNLTPSGFKLWTYFDKNQEGYTMAVGPSSVVEWGIKRSTFKTAMNELIEVGYLVETSPNHFSFYEMPQEVVYNITIEKKYDEDFIF